MICHPSISVIYWDYKTNNKSTNLTDVESAQEIRKRLVAPGISLGALEPRSA